MAVMHAETGKGADSMLDAARSSLKYCEHFRIREVRGSGGYDGVLEGTALLS